MASTQRPRVQPRTPARAAARSPAPRVVRPDPPVPPASVARCPNPLTVRAQLPASSPPRAARLQQIPFSPPVILQAFPWARPPRIPAGPYLAPHGPPLHLIPIPQHSPTTSQRRRLALLYRSRACCESPLPVPLRPRRPVPQHRQVPPRRATGTRSPETHSSGSPHERRPTPPPVFAAGSPARPPRSIRAAVRTVATSPFLCTHCHRS